MFSHPPKYPRTKHWPWSETVHQDDSYHQNPNIFIGKEVVISEKLDGGNSSLWNGEVYARSTGQPATQGWFALVKKYQTWKTLGNIDQIFYGEDLSAKHSIQYSIPMDQTYFVFHILQNDVFMSVDDMERIAINAGFNTVPIVFRGTFNKLDQITNFFKTEINKPSAYGVEREGFVIRIADEIKHEDFSNKVAKFVRKNHVQPNAQHWTQSWSWNELLPGEY